MVSWTGQGGTEMRARYAIDGGQPSIRDLAVRKTGGTWGVLGQNLKPEFKRDDRHPTRLDAAARSAQGGRRRDHPRGHCQEPLVRLLGLAAPDCRTASRCASCGRRGCRGPPLIPPRSHASRRPRPRADRWAPDSRPRRGRAAGGPRAAHHLRSGRRPAAAAARRPQHRRAAQREGHHPRERLLQRLVVHREDRRRGDRGDVPGPDDGDFRRRPPLHRVSRHQPAADGGARPRPTKSGSPTSTTPA